MIQFITYLCLLNHLLQQMKDFNGIAWKIVEDQFQDCVLSSRMVIRVKNFTRHEAKHLFSAAMATLFLPSFLKTCF